MNNKDHEMLSKEEGEETRKKEKELSPSKIVFSVNIWRHVDKENPRGN